MKFVRHSPAVCQHCEGASGHPPIPGEGALVCLPCVWRLGRKVQEASLLADEIDQAAIDRRLRELGWVE